MVYDRVNFSEDAQLNDKDIDVLHKHFANKPEYVLRDDESRLPTLFHRGKNNSIITSTSKLLRDLSN